jgi:hypothetical protein
MTSHIFAIGQCVNLRRTGAATTKPLQVFVVKALLPPLGGGTSGLEFQYRIKSEGESYERVAVEHQLEGTGPIEAAGGAAATPPSLKPSPRKVAAAKSSVVKSSVAKSSVLNAEAQRVFAVRP